MGRTLAEPRMTGGIPACPWYGGHLCYAGLESVRNVGLAQDTVGSGGAHGTLLCSVVPATPVAAPQPSGSAAAAVRPPVSTTTGRPPVR